MKSLDDWTKLIQNPRFYFKLIIAALCLISVLIWSLRAKIFRTDPADDAVMVDDALTMIGTGGHLIITCVFILAYIYDESDRYFELWFLPFGFITLVFGGTLKFIICLIHDANAFSVITAISMIIAGICTFIDWARVQQPVSEEVVT